MRGHPVIGAEVVKSACDLFWVKTRQPHYKPDEKSAACYGIVCPPSTEMVCPVTNKLSSDAKKTAAP